MEKHYKQQSTNQTELLMVMARVFLSWLVVGAPCTIDVVLLVGCCILCLEIFSSNWIDCLYSVISYALNYLIFALGFVFNFVISHVILESKVNNVLQVKESHQPLTGLQC